jgi:hypothetical protein
MTSLLVLIAFSHAGIDSSNWIRNMPSSYLTLDSMGALVRRQVNVMAR